MAMLVGGAGCEAARQRRKARAAKPDVPPVSQQELAKYSDPMMVYQLRQRAVTLLTQLAKDPSPQVRANAIEALADSPEVLGPLIPEALHDENIGVRSTAALMVGRMRMGHAAVDVRRLLQDPSPFVRASAIYALSRCGEPVDVTPMAGMLLGDPSPRVRSHVAYLLGELREPSALPLLQEAARAPTLKSAPSEVRIMQLQISEAMVKLGDDTQVEVIRAALYPSRPEDLEVAALAVQVIGQVHDRGAVDQLIYMTAYRDEKGGQMPAEIRLGAAISLAKLGQTQGTFIAEEYMESPTPVLRAQAAFAFGQIGRAENLPRLEKMMDDPEGITRVSAAAGVLKVGSAMALHGGGN